MSTEEVIGSAEAKAGGIGAGEREWRERGVKVVSLSFFQRARSVVAVRLRELKKRRGKD